MKLFNQFNILPKYLTAFNYAGLNLNETPKELEQCTVEFQNFWDKECRENPTNQNCLIYCDWGIIELLLFSFFDFALTKLQPNLFSKDSEENKWLLFQIEILIRVILDWTFRYFYRLNKLDKPMDLWFYDARYWWSDFSIS